MIRRSFATKHLALARRHAWTWRLAGIMALAVYVGALGGPALVRLSETAGRAEILTGIASLQLPPDTSTARLSTALALLRQTAGVMEVRVQEPPESTRLVSTVLGSSGRAEPMPMPRIVNIRIDGAPPAELAALRQKLVQIVPDAQFEPHRLLSKAKRPGVLWDIGAAAATLAVITLAATFAVARFVRHGLRIDCDTIELLRLLGARDAQIALPYQAAALRLAAIGGAAGAAAAAITALALGRGAWPIAGISLDGIMDWRVWPAAAGGVLAGAAVAAFSARATVLRRLALMP